MSKLLNKCKKKHLKARPILYLEFEYDFMIERMMENYLKDCKMSTQGSQGWV